ncbi:putative bifunctional diguanylate cyclase/phosphodiesterase [Gilvimarinus xylanilyticus]|uniref:EAL domain-containing protein n=1 Tax=Gilvimarinus xylanilyticus TaxID=2944139 RepID=A0A9X2KU01_9GAMM|nr:EAL domain-containing protein [Gilvimarinus xylanilyticus]MCP8899727.1 EAL domain-containing protein [Gilvimarinus xylanilyticus]
MDRSQPQFAPPFKIALLVAGLLTLLGLATSMSVGMVQLQAAASAYLSGLSVWNQSQIGAVHHLSRYAEQGQRSDLQAAREYLSVPLSDRHGRLELEAKSSDDVVVAAFVRGANHPDDARLMIWLYRDFGDLGQLQRAFSLWRDSDPYILELARIADDLEHYWRGPPNPQRLQQLKQALHGNNIRLQQLASEFREVMTSTNRWLTDTLTLASLVFFIVFAVLASLLIWRLVRLLQGTQEKFQAIFTQAAVGIVHLDAAGVVTRANPAIADILNIQAEQLTGTPLRDFVHPEDWEIDDAQCRQLATGVLPRFTVEQRLNRLGGGVLWARLTYSRASSAADCVVIVEDISESRRLSKELNFQATHDVLTGLYNRRAFERRLGESFKRARVEGTSHALCFIDLDQFKVVNDTSGHFAGDRLLQQVVDVFRRELRDCDMFARLGGDEFAMVLENCSLEAAEKVAEKLRAALEEFHFSWDGHSYNISCSIGVVAISATAQNTESIMRAADIACYLAKDKGRNRVYVSRENDQFQQQREGEMHWLGRIREAMENDRLFLDAQRIAPLQQETDLLSYEVLVRLRDESGKIVSPAAFLPAAERFGAANQIDRWVIEHTLSLLAAHPKHLQKLAKCHINLSGVSLDQPEFYTFVVQCFERYPVPPEKICFEVTETAAVNNLLEAIALMEALGEIGCSFALDDFGTGLSSFSYLRRLPVDTLKIDGVFVRDIVDDKTDLAMVRAINEVGQTLSKSTIAEFVENDECLQLLKAMGVDYAQGFGVHKPSSLIELLKETDC